MTWSCLHCHSEYSLLDGLSKTKDIIKRCLDVGIKNCALTDHGSISGIPSFFDEAKDKIKPIAGCEFYISNNDASIKEQSNKTSHLCVLAKNINGWKGLIKATSESHKKEFFYRKPRLDLERLSKFSENNFIVFSGHIGSALADIIFEEPSLAYKVKTEKEAKLLAKKKWHIEVCNLIEKYQTLFGKENFFIEIQLIDQKNLPATTVIAEGLRWAGKKMGVRCIATADSHYPRKEDAVDQRILLCSAFQQTLSQIQSKIDNDEDVALGGFFKSNNYHIPSIDEINNIYLQDEIDNSNIIADMCDNYSIAQQPLFPKFQCPNGKTEKQYMNDICADGWKRKIKNVNKKEYADRVKYELQVLQDAGLSGYFLIVNDYIRYAKEKLKSIVGKGRGSSAGSLVSYLMDITEIDSIKYDLYFERFYNAGRNTNDRVALPDIDTDFLCEDREKIINYIRSKYGHENVAQMCTFQRLQGKSALKEVLRIHAACSFEEMNKITEFIPDEAEISDKLQEMKEEYPDAEPSIILWALQNNPEKFSNWCVLEKDGSFSGQFSIYFEQAIRIEGIKKSVGRHASGLIISSVPISDICPMIADKSSDEMIVGVDMRVAEKMGLVKFDILGTRVLDKISTAIKIIRKLYVA